MGHLRESVTSLGLDHHGALNYLYGAICATVDYAGNTDSEKVQHIKKLADDFRSAFPMKNNGGITR